jgi:valyl-tRNA synthetase
VPAWLRARHLEGQRRSRQHLRDSGHLFYDHKFTHSYPHDWRSKTPVIFRCTEQWFVGVDRADQAHNAPAQPARRLALDATTEGGTSRDLRPRVGPQPHARHARIPPRLVHQPPACVGSADPGVPSQGPEARSS